jgi:hypothetical protein
MYRLIFCLWLLAAQGLALEAQNVRLSEDPLVAQMMSKFVERNKSQATIEGWRIEILATTNRQQMESVMQTFQYRYPSLPVDWVHTNPYFKLRVGAFANKMDASRMLHMLKRDYPAAYLVMDNRMRPEELIN